MSLKEPNWLNSVDFMYIIGLIGVRYAWLNILKSYKLKRGLEDNNFQVGVFLREKASVGSPVTCQPAS
jgi:hypothetical protein